jgi:hypothetical protein
MKLIVYAWAVFSSRYRLNTEGKIKNGSKIMMITPETIKSDLFIKQLQTESGLVDDKQPQK